VVLVTRAVVVYVLGIVNVAQALNGILAMAALG
jgi:hypothetical protein